MASTKIGTPIASPIPPGQESKIAQSQAALKVSLLPNSIPKDDDSQFDASPRAALPYESQTAIKSDSPEIILNSNFEPIWNEDLTLSDFGKSLQDKYYAYSSSVMATLSSLLNSPEFESIKTQAQDNRNEIYKFANETQSEMSSLISDLETLRKNFDPRYYKLGFAGEIAGRTNYENEYPPYAGGLSVILDGVFSTNGTSTYDPAYKWTATKFWIQVCKELEEILRRGAPTKLLSKQSSPFSLPGDYVNSANPFLIVPSGGGTISKFYWKSTQFAVPQLTLAEITSLLASNFNQTKDLFKRAFSSSAFNSVLNKNSESMSDTIAKMAFTLCKEYMYSTTLYKSQNSPITNNNFSPDATDIWDYIIGQHGKDVTDISANSVFENALIGLSGRKYVKQGGNSDIEILTFEDRYITDDIGTRASSQSKSVITPGFIHYIEDVFDSVDVSNNFQGNFSNINFLTNKAQACASRFDYMLNMSIFSRQPSSINWEPKSKLEQKLVPSNQQDRDFFYAYHRALLDKTQIADYTDPKKQTTKQIASQFDAKVTYVESLSHPIKLIRAIQANLLDGTPLLDRNAVTVLDGFNNRQQEVNKLWGPEGYVADDNNPETITFEFFRSLTRGEKQPTDPSWLLISEAIDDPTLMSYLYIYSRVSATNATNIDVETELLEQTGIPNPGGVFVNGDVEGVFLNGTGNYDITDVLGVRILQRLRKKIPATLTSAELSSIIQTTGSDYVNVPGVFYLDARQFLNKCTILKNCGKFLWNILNSTLLLSSWLTVPNDSAAGQPASFEVRKSKHSNISLGTFLVELFRLCCYMVHAANPERIVGRFNTSNEYDDYANGYEQPSFFLVKRVNPFIKGAYSKNSFNNAKAPNITLYHADKVFYDAEALIDEQNLAVGKTVATMHDWLLNFTKKITEFRDSFQLPSGKFKKFLNKFNSVGIASSLAKSAFTKEQLLLNSSKMVDLLDRSNTTYDSPVRSGPFFAASNTTPDTNLFLPLDDLSLSSYFLIKGFFRQSKYAKNSFNKKILSVGIPNRLLRRLQVNASSLTGSTRKGSLIKLKVYRKDYFNSNLIHKPQEFIFDIARFPRRIAKPYGSLVNFENLIGPSVFVPVLSYGKFNTTSIANDSNSTPASLTSFNEAASYYSFLSSSDRAKLEENHKTSLMLEYYLYWLSNTKLDEHRYRFYGGTSLVSAATTSNAPTISSPNPSFSSYFNDETFLQEINSLKKKLLTPKKFDRVFHLAIDPDDFYVDVPLTQQVLGPNVDIQQAFGDKLSYTTQGNSVSVRRKDTDVDEITFDSYWVTIETYNENTTIAGS
jgi:hypothetical protein